VSCSHRWCNTVQRRLAAINRNVSPATEPPLLCNRLASGYHVTWLLIDDLLYLHCWLMYLHLYLQPAPRTLSSTGGPCTAMVLHLRSTPCRYMHVLPDVHGVTFHCVSAPIPFSGISGPSSAVRYQQLPTMIPVLYSDQNGHSQQISEGSRTQCLLKLSHSAAVACHAGHSCEVSMD
jgi:hypothetical protein